MNFQFANLNIEKIIVHQIFVRNEAREIVEPKYNDEFSVLDTQGLDELQKRITKAIGNDSHCIEMEVSNFNENSTFQCTAKLISSKDEEFIKISKELTYKLAQAQASRIIPGGIVVIFKGTIGEKSDNCIGIIKAEKHGGFSVTETLTKLLFEFLSNLLLTPQQKLYKIAMFIERNEPSSIDVSRRPDEFKVYVFDHNMNKSETKEAALYFYETFLGCSIHHSNRKLTKDFYTNTRTYINSLDVEDEKKVDLVNALHTYLKVDQSNTIQTSDFANKYFDNEDIKDEYISFMEEQKVPTHAIPKDLTFIKRKLRRRKINFSTKVSIIAPSDKFNDLVKVIKVENDKTTIEIDGHIEKQD